MSLYRCAACGSPNVVTDTQNDGVKYDYLKGAVGTVVLGVGGAAAGITSKISQVYKCPDCGITLTYPMPEEIKQAIEFGIMDADARENLTLMGVPVLWSTLVTKYKNIESGLADEAIKSRKLDEENAKISYEEVIARGLEEEQAFMSDQTAMEEMQKIWEIEQKTLAPQVQQQIEYLILSKRKQISDKQQKSKAKFDKEEKELSSKEQKLLDEYNALQKHLSSLGLFKMSEKKHTQARMDDIDKHLASIKAMLVASVSERKKVIAKLNEDEANINELTEKEIYVLNRVPSSPKQKEKRIQYLQKIRKTVSLQNKSKILDYVTFYMEQTGKPVKLSDLVTKQGNKVFDKFGMDVPFRSINIYLEAAAQDGILISAYDIPENDELGLGQEKNKIFWLA